MHNRWFRSGNFFTPVEHKLYYSPLKYRVDFRNVGFASTLRQLTLLLYNDGEMTLHLDISPFHINEYRNKCDEIFTKKQVNVIHSTLLSIAYNRDHSLTKLFTLFDYFNKKYNRIEFTDKLILELTQINSLLPLMNHAQWKQQKHVLSEENVVKTHINPAKRNSRQINQLISRKFSFSKFRKALVSGEDPNQRNDDGGSLNETASYKLLRDMDGIRAMNSRISRIELYASLQLLYFYGANVFDRSNGGKWYQSDFELAYVSNNTIVLNWIMKILNTLEKPLANKENIKKLFVSSISSHSDEKTQNYKTGFHFSNGKTLISRLIPSGKLNVEEKSQCFVLFKKFFKDPNNNEENVVAVFNDSFSSAENRFVELIYLDAPCSETKGHTLLCGINLKELYLSRVVPNHIVVHGVYTFLEPQLRQYKMSSLLAFCLPFVIQLLYPHHKVAFIYSPTHFSAYSMLNIAETLLHCPKHQSALIQLIIDEFILITYANEATVIHEEMSWGIREKFPLVSTAPETKKETSFLEDNYKKFIANGNYPLVAWHASRESLEEIKEAAKQLGFDFLTFAHQEANKLKTLVEKTLKKPASTLKPLYAPFKLFQNETDLFWNEGNIQNIRAKL